VGRPQGFGGLVDWVLLLAMAFFVLLAGGGDSSIRDGRFPALLRGVRSRDISLKISDTRVLVSREERGDDAVDV
jgi:hypothetical protein